MFSTSFPISSLDIFPRHPSSIFSRSREPAALRTKSIMSGNSNPRRKPQTTRTLTPTTFTKAMDVRPFFNIYNVDTSKKWPAKRIWNEVTALKLIRENTTIPVPLVLDTGKNDNGFYLTVERVDGINLTEVKDRCRQASKHDRLPDGHTKKNCTACQTIANQNAERFITDVMLPQLKSLTSSQTGLNSTVIPPPWVTEYDVRETWSSKTSAQQSFVFCHGDLGPQNLKCDPVTLKIVRAVDWENAGYFEEEFLHLWAVDRDTYLDLYDYNDRLARQIARLEG